MLQGAPSGGWHWSAPLGNDRVGTVRVGTIRVDTIRVGTVRVGTIRVGTIWEGSFKKDIWCYKVLHLGVGTVRVD